MQSLEAVVIAGEAAREKQLAEARANEPNEPRDGGRRIEYESGGRRKRRPRSPLPALDPTSGAA